MLSIISRKKLIIVLILLLAVFPISGSRCTDPISGKREFNIVSLEQELALGKEAHREITRKIGLYYNPKLKKYVNNIGQRLASVSHRQKFPYHFNILDSPQINAFALPGGYVYVCRGILEIMNSEAELAAVLGHEIGHVAARHGVEQLSKAQGFAWLSIGINILLQKKGANPKKTQQIVNTLINLTMLGYSRKQEYQADLLSLEYTTKAGFNPMGVVNLLKQMKLIEKGTPSKLGTFFSTHPLTRERTDKVKTEIEAQVKDKSVFKRSYNVNMYLQQLKGLFMGEKPKGGLIIKDKWISPNFRYSLKTLKGFIIKQINQEFVGFDNKDLDEHVLMEAFSIDNVKHPKDIAKYLEKKIPMVKISAQGTSFRKLYAYRVLYREKNDGVVYLVKRLYFLNGPRGYVLSYYIPEKRYMKASDKWGQILNNFRFLTSYQALKHVGQFMNIGWASPGQNFRHLAKKYYKDEGLGRKLAIYNGHNDSFYTFKRGMRIKIPPKKRLLN